MTTELEFATLPHVLDDDGPEFVLRFEPDPRPAMSIGGAAYRRGSERYVIEWPLDWLRMRATVSSAGADCYVATSVGPMFNEWWPLLKRSKPDSTRPVLSAAASGRSIIFVEPTDELPVEIGFVRGGEGLPAGGDVSPTTLAATKLSGALTQQNMLLAHIASLAVIKAALSMLLEYRTLQADIPAINISSEGASIRLSTLLEIAENAANAISWTYKPDGV